MLVLLSPLVHTPFSPTPLMTPLTYSAVQVMDNAISAIFHHSCALNLSPFENAGSNETMTESLRFWSCQNTNDVTNGNPWGCHVVVSMGYLVAMVIALPMGCVRLACLTAFCPIMTRHGHCQRAHDPNVSPCVAGSISTTT